MPARLQSLFLVLNTQNAASEVTAQIRRVWTLCPNDPTEETTPALQAVQSAGARGVPALLQGYGAREPPVIPPCDQHHQADSLAGLRLEPRGKAEADASMMCKVAAVTAFGKSQTTFPPTDFCPAWGKEPFFHSLFVCPPLYYIICTI